MKLYKHLFIFIIFFMAACTTAESTPPADIQATEISRQIATEVSRRLTAIPPATVNGTKQGPTEILATATLTASPSPTQEPTTTPVATRTATPFPTDPKQDLGNPTWQDTFADAANWYLYEDDHSKIELEDGNLLLNAKNPDGWSSWALTWPQLDDFYLEAVLTPGECTGLDRYGVVFRANSQDEAYLFGATCDGSYSLRKWDGNLFSMVQIWTPSPAVRSGAGQTNVIGILVQGDKMAMYINDQFLGVVSDTSIGAGAVGLFVGSVNTPNFQVAAQEIAFWDLR